MLPVGTAGMKSKVSVILKAVQLIADIWQQVNIIICYIGLATNRGFFHYMVIAQEMTFTTGLNIRISSIYHTESEFANCSS